MTSERPTLSRRRQSALALTLCVVAAFACPTTLLGQDTASSARDAPTPDAPSVDTASDRAATGAETRSLPQQIQPDSAVPAVYEAVPRANAVVDSAESAILEIERLAGLEFAARQAGSAERTLQGLEERLEALVESEYVRSDRISAVHDGALASADRLETVGGTIASRLEGLGEMRRRWQEKRALWDRWQASLADDADYELLAPDVDEAVGATTRVLDRLATAYPDVLEVQRRVESLRRRLGQLADEAENLRSLRRDALLKRSSPVLFSPAYAEQFDTELFRRAAEEAQGAMADVAAYVPGVSLLFLIHVLLVFGLAYLARGFRARAGERDPVFARPLSIGVFVTTALLGPAYAPAPPVWEVLTWAALSISGSRIASRVLRDRRTRTIVYIVALFYPLFLAMEALSLPAPLFRPGLLALLLIAVAIHLVWTRRGDGPGVDTAGGRWSTRLAGAVVLFVGGADILGLDQLAFWVFQASVAAVFVVFVVLLLIRLTRSTIQTMLRTEPKGRFRFIRRIGYQLADRLTWLVQAFLWLGATLYILDVWEIAPSPLQTWNALTGAGIEVGDLEITVGRVFLAILVLYLVTIVSWLARASVETAGQERWHLDRGVSNSISRILHYSLIAVGFLLAARALGVGLSNFALIAGALGVGIGFGLQNVVNNFVSGLILLFERPIRVGDIITFGGQWGTIKHIGLRATTLRDFDESETVIPNADLVAQRVTNWTLSNSLARLAIPVGVAYGSDVEKVFAVLLEAAREEELVLDPPEPQALFRGFGDSSLNFELRIWLGDVRDMPRLQSAMVSSIERRLRAAGIEIPFPQRDLHVRSIKPGASLPSVPDPMPEAAASDAGSTE